MQEEPDEASADPANVASSGHNHSPHETHDSIYKDAGKKETRYSHAVEKDKKAIPTQQQKHQYKSQNFKNMHEARAQNTRAPKSQGATEKVKSQKYESDQAPPSSKGEEKGGIVLPKVRNQQKPTIMNGRAERFESKHAKEADRHGKNISSSQPQSAALEPAQKKLAQAMEGRQDRASQDASRKQLKLITQSSAGGSNLDRLLLQKDDKPYKDEEKRAANNRSDKAGSRLNSILL